MEVDKTPLALEVEAIINDGPKPVNYHWSLSLIAGGETIPVLKVISHVIRRAYNTDYADDIIVKFAIGAGTFHHRIYPHRQNLQAILFREPIGEVSNAMQLTSDIEAQVMRATLVGTSSAVMEGNRRHVDNAADMDIMDLIEVEIGLTDLALEQIRMMNIDGIYRDCSVSELMRHLLTLASQTVTDDDDIAIQGVDLYEPSTTEPVPSIIIPTGTRLFELPDYLSKYVGGIYNTGFGFYLQKKNWYIYPLFDLTRYENSVKGLTLLRLPADSFTLSERTYRKTANQVIAMVTENSRTADPSEGLQLNLGNGVRYADANALFDGFGKTQNNKTTVKRKENNTEYLVEDRPNGMNNLQTGDRRITSNALNQASQMAQRLGMYMTCSWENSDPGSIFPGMPVRYVFMVNNEVFESFGIVEAAEHYTTMTEPGFTSKRHRTSTSLLLFLGKATPWNE